MITEDQLDALGGNLGTPSTTNKYVTQHGLQKGAEIYAADGEASDTYVITLSPVPAAYYAGMVLHFMANTANTGACTLNVNSLGAKTIKKQNDQDTETGDIEAGQIVTVVYDGTNFQMQSQSALGDQTIWGMTASDNLVQSADTERSGSHVNETIKKSIRLNRAGTARIKFDYKQDVSGGGNSTTFKLRLKSSDGDLSGVDLDNIDLGTVGSTSDVYVTYSSDLVIPHAGEVQLSLYYTAGTPTGYVKNFRVYYDIEALNEADVVTD